MNRALLFAMLRSRFSILIVALVMALFPRVFEMVRGGGFIWHHPMLGGVLGMCYLVDGTLLAALLGSELPSAGPGGWSWLLARPVSRRRVLALRLLSDVVVMALVALCFLVLVGPPEGRGWLIVLLLWAAAHGTAAGASSLGLATLPALALGALQVGVVALVAGAAVLLSLDQATQAGLGSLNGLNTLLRSFSENGLLPPEWVQTFPWFLAWPLIGGAIGLLFATLWGWRSAAQRMRLSPAPLPPGRFALQTGLGLLALCVALSATTAVAARALTSP